MAQRFGPLECLSLFGPKPFNSSCIIFVQTSARLTGRPLRLPHRSGNCFA